MTLFEMDGTTYEIDITELSIDGQFLYKYAERVENGDFKAEGIGFFENMSITFKGTPNNDFAQLYSDLKELQADGTFNHDIKTITPLGEYTQKAYPDKLGVPIARYDESINSWWGEMTVKFIAVSKRV